MEPWVLTIVIFASLVIGLVSGLPIAFVLAGVAIFFIFLLWGPEGFFMVSGHLYSKGMSFVFITLPLFVLMANFLQVSGIADDLYDAMYSWVVHIPGGLASGTIVICAIFAAMVGISGAATLTMGMIAVPSMLKRRYDKRLAVGTVAAGGALGILIPPSGMMIIYGMLTDTSIGHLFMGGVIPGIILAILFIIYISVRSFAQPELGPPSSERFTWGERILSLRSVALPLALVFLVLGTIYLGVCTPTEAAGIGALGSIICCAIHHSLTWQNVKTAVRRSLTITVMCLWIVVGAHCFIGIYIVSGATEVVLGAVEALTLPPIGLIVIMMVIWMFMGMIIDPIGMLMVTLPVFIPIAATLGYDPVWFGILYIVNCEMAYVTPPFGMNLFYLKSIVPPEITMADLYRSVFPFVVCQFACLMLVVFLPQLALWLPSTM